MATEPRQVAPHFAHKVVPDTGSQTSGRLQMRPGPAHNNKPRLLRLCYLQLACSRPRARASSAHWHAAVYTAFVRSKRTRPADVGSASLQLEVSFNGASLRDLARLPAVASVLGLGCSAPSRYTRICAACGARSSGLAPLSMLASFFF
jgi:hypothetical protein